MPSVSSLAPAHLRALPWLVWGLGVLFYFYEFLLQVSPSVMVNDLMRDFNVSATELGNLAAVYSYVYAGMQIPVGALLDRYGPRRLLTFAAFICAMGSFMFAKATTLGIVDLGRMLIGFGSAFAAISCLKLAANWFAFNRFALLTGLTVMVGMLGAINGQAPLAMLIEKFSWRQSMHLLAWLGIVLSLTLYLVVRDKPAGQPSAETSLNFSLWQGLKYTLSNKQTWLTSIYGGLMFAPTTAFAGLWGVPFLTTAYGLSRPAAAGMTSLIFVGWVIGGPVWGWLSDRWQRRKLPLVIASIGTLLSLTPIIYLSHLPLSVLNSLLWGVGFFSGGFLPAFSIVKEINPLRYNATALGFMNTLNMLGGAMAQAIIGYVLDMTWHGKVSAGARLYQTNNFQAALLLLPLMLFLALVLLPFIKETHGKIAQPRI
jgi:MFS family permease